MRKERREYFPRDEILSEVASSLARHAPGEIDWVTFVGSGEPVLHIGLGWLISKVKALTNLPIAVITNGSLLYLPQVRSELVEADAVMPSLDAGSAALYRQINRPHPDASFERLVDGLIAFRHVFPGKLWVEVMLLRGLNDREEALRDIAGVLCRIQPDEVHINLPTRPPAETWVCSPDEEGMMRAMAILGKSTKVVHPAEGAFDLGSEGNLVDAIIGIITRHPMRQEELERAVAQWAPEEIEEALADLRLSGQAQIVERLGSQFWSAASAYYPDQVRSQAAAPKPA